MLYRISPFLLLLLLLLRTFLILLHVFLTSSSSCRRRRRRCWLGFNTIFPPTLEHEDYEAQNNVFANLMVISTSLALGLVLGFGIVRAGETCCNTAGRGSKTLVPW